jgi:Tfp pilus assembly protein PilF
MINLTKFNQILDTIKNASVALLGLIALSFVSVVFIKSFNASELTFESIRVPETFVVAGYTSQITVTEILDEVTKIHNLPIAGNNDNRKTIYSNKSGDNLSRLEAIPGAGGIDYRSIQSVIQETFGVTKETLSGEITDKKNGDELIYHVRVRLMPQNKLLVDFSSKSDIPQLIKQIAMHLIENLEPTVAASYYRFKNDPENAIRLLDQAINDGNESDDLIALSQRASILAQSGKYVLAQDYLNRAFAINSKSPHALIAQSFLFNKQKKYTESLAYAKQASEYWSNQSQPFNNMAIANVGLENYDDAEKNFLKAISLGGISISMYIDASDFFVTRGKPELAEKALIQGIKKRPDDISLLLAYANLLIQQKKYEHAGHYLNQAFNRDPKNELIHSAIFQLPDGFESKLKKQINEKE